MEDTNKKIDANFFQLVLSLQMTAMQQMGKIVSPLTGNVERNLVQAQASIDMLNMISEKTKNNLSEDEKSLLDRILYELRMNYVDESKKPDEKPAEKPNESEKTEDDKTASGETQGKNEDKSKSEDTDGVEEQKE